MDPPGIFKTGTTASTNNEGRMTRSKTKRKQQPIDSSPQVAVQNEPTDWEMPYQNSDAEVHHGNETTEDKVFDNHDPLQIPEMLSKIFTHLNPDVKQLKVLRLVCKRWCQAVFEQWRDSAALTILQEDTEQPSAKTDAISLSKFMQEFQDPRSPFKFLENPFSSYKIKDFDLDILDSPLFTSVVGTRDQDQLFWKTVGPLMKYVHFDGSIILKTVHKAFVQFVFSCTPNVEHVVLTNVRTAFKTRNDVPWDRKNRVFKQMIPNLKTLEVRGRNSVLNIHNKQDIFESAPNLQTIRGIDLPSSKLLYGNLMQSMQSTLTSAKSPKKARTILQSLEHLDLMESSSFSYRRFGYELQNLAEFDVKLPLKVLSVHLYPHILEPNCMNIGNRDMEPFLSCLHKTLEVVKIFRAPICDPLREFLNKNEMPVLKEVHLSGAVAPNFHFLKHAPNLKKLCIELGCFKKQDKIREMLESEEFRESAKYIKYENDMTQFVCMNCMEGCLCEELEHLEIDFEFPVESLKLLGKWMPNLKTLKTILNEETISVVCEQWEDLTELVCSYGSKVPNSSFVGGHGHPRCIRDLRKLERFQLDTFCGEAEITGEAIFNGLLKMSSLTTVGICVSSQMSQKAEDALRNSMKFCDVIKNCRRTNGTGKNECCERLKFRDDAASVLRRSNVRTRSQTKDKTT